MSPSGGECGVRIIHKIVYSLYFIIFILILIGQCPQTVECLHVQGRWNSSQDFLKIIARFAIQKTDVEHMDETRGYAYGNVTASNSSLTKVLLFVNSSLFNKIYDTIHDNKDDDQRISNKTGKKLTKSERNSIHCADVQALLEGDTLLNSSAQLSHTNIIDARENSVHYIPCPANRLCNNSPNPPTSSSLWPYQYTYFVDSFHDSTFWFLLLLSCKPQLPENSTNNLFGQINNSHLTAEWTVSLTDPEIQYNFWIVNGHPEKLASFWIDFDHQFSFEQQNLMFYYGWLVCFVVLLILQCCTVAFRRLLHRNCNYLFTLCLVAHCCSYLFYCIHKTVFSFDGNGFLWLQTSGDYIKLFSTSLFMLFTLIIAKGWQVNRRNFYSKTMIFTLWTVYTVIRFILSIWIKETIDFITEVDEYNTMFGWIELGLRMAFMVWFVRELRHTMVLEQDSRKLRFYLHFGGAMLVWFVSLPLVVVISIQIEIMSRFKIISGFSSAADVFAYGYVTLLMWKTSTKRFEHNSDIEQRDEDFYGSFRTEALSINIRQQRECNDKANSCDTSRLA